MESSSAKPEALNCMNCGGFTHDFSLAAVAAGSCNKEYISRVKTAENQNKGIERKYKKAVKLMEEVSKLLTEIKNIDKSIKKAPKHKEIQQYIKESKMRSKAAQYSVGRIE